MGGMAMMIDGEIAYAGLPLRFGEGEEGIGNWAIERERMKRGIVTDELGRGEDREEECCEMWNN